MGLEMEALVKYNEVCVGGMLDCGAMVWMFVTKPNSEKRQPWADMV